MKVLYTLSPSATYFQLLSIIQVPLLHWDPFFQDGGLIPHWKSLWNYQNHAKLLEISKTASPLIYSKLFKLPWEQLGLSHSSFQASFAFTFSAGLQALCYPLFFSLYALFLDDQIHFDDSFIHGWWGPYLFVCFQSFSSPFLDVYFLDISVKRFH